MPYVRCHAQRASVMRSPCRRSVTVYVLGRVQRSPRVVSHSHRVLMVCIPSSFSRPTPLKIHTPPDTVNSLSLQVSRECS